MEACEWQRKVTFFFETAWESRVSVTKGINIIIKSKLTFTKALILENARAYNELFLDMKAAVSKKSVMNA